MEPNYYSKLTNDVIFSDKIRDCEKILFAVITSLCMSKGYCWATNQYLADLFKLHKKTISERISNLQKAGFLDIELIREGKEIKERRIYPIMTPLHRTADTPSPPNGGDPSPPSGGHPIHQTAEDINTISSNINSNNILEHPAFTNQQEAEKELKERLRESFWQQLADKTTWSWPKEGAAVKQLVEKAMTKEEPEEFLRRLVLTFHALREGGNDYWRKQPFLPSRLNSSGIYAGVVAEMTASCRKEEKASRQYDEIYSAVCGEGE